MLAADKADAVPSWRQPPQHNLDGSTVELRPWPRDGDEISELVWLSASAAWPWIPRLSDLEQLWADRHKRLSPRPETEDETKRKPSRKLTRQLTGA